MGETPRPQGQQPDDVYATAAMRAAAPSAGFPEVGMGSGTAYALVRDEMLLDGVARMNLATFCTTWVTPEARSIMDEALVKNIVDKDEYPQTSEMEARCVRMLAELWHAPSPETTVGTSTTGSSEAAMLCGLAAKFRWRERMRRAGRPADRPNFVCGPVQVCWEKFARYFDVEMRRIPLEDDRYVMTPGEIAPHCDENTIMVVANFGQTYTGLYEDVATMGEVLDLLEQERGLDIPLHVDAASGGFLAPFTAPELEWDFRVGRVKSVNASGHKSGLAPIGVGWAIWREAADLPEELVFNVSYLGGTMPTFNLNFSRPGGQVIAQYYDFIRLGRDGYRGVQSALYDAAAHLAQGIASFGLFDVIHGGRPDQGIAAVCWRLRSEQNFNLYALADRLRTRGWLVPAYPLAENRQDVVVQRALVRHGFSFDTAEMLLEDIQRSLEHLTHHPAVLTFEEAGSFSHNGHPAVAPPHR
ncbi:glutamate decarboxylase [Rhizohabitans arisaemae]|uniref:glutamate decarboxylase n=1 Tax=Rhizohabitans arisaemae TaxID=2720610 RepID=UPI0024B19630|nr:glutamate decarboxylase [Rhizohabitans arisaemae]